MFVFSLLILFYILIFNVLNLIGLNTIVDILEARISGTTIIIIIVLFILVIAFIAYIINIFNILVNLRNNIDKTWKNIEVVLIQRHDEISKLVEVCKLYIEHEKEVMESIAKYRNYFYQTNLLKEKTATENNLNVKMDEMNVIIENYPKLKANQNFNKIMTAIKEIETIISERRIFFNETLTIYNTQIAQFPCLIFTWILGYEKQSYLYNPDTILKKKIGN